MIGELRDSTLSPLRAAAASSSVETSSLTATFVSRRLAR